MPVTWDVEYLGKIGKSREGDLRDTIYDVINGQAFKGLSPYGCCLQRVIQSSTLYAIAADHFARAKMIPRLMLLFPGET